MHGAGTVRADPLSARVPNDLVHERVSRGLARQPVGAIVTRSGNLPAQHPYYESATIVYVTSNHPVPTPSSVEVRRVSNVDEVVRDLARRGFKRVLCEGGPTLNAALFAHQLIDEVFLTIAPKLVGGEDPLTIVKGAAFEVPIGLEVRSLVELEGELFVRYGVNYRA
jgi:2,5-diamino-6-(ribosylamino)-4(3H)-pyrimidinone 5'-phosphate reductase